MGSLACPEVNCPLPFENLMRFGHSLDGTEFLPDQVDPTTSTNEQADLPPCQKATPAQDGISPKAGPREDLIWIDSESPINTIGHLRPGKCRSRSDRELNRLPCATSIPIFQ